MLDVMSGGRLVAGFPVGTSMDTNYAYGRIPATLRETLRRGARTDHEGLGGATSRSPSTAGTPSCATSIAGRSRCRSRTRRSASPAAARSRLTISASRTTTITPTSAFSAYLRARRLMENYWQASPRWGADDSPTAPAFAQNICVAETDAEAERLYGPHVSYFFNRCLHVYPGFADAPGYRTIKTIQAGFLNQLSRANLGHAATLSWQELIERGYIVAGSPETVRQRMEELIKRLRVGNIICLIQMGDMPTEKTCHSTEMFATQGDAAPQGHLEGLRKRRALLDPPAAASRSARRHRCGEPEMSGSLPFGARCRRRAPQDPRLRSRRWCRRSFFCTAPVAWRRKVRSSPRWPAAGMCSRRYSRATAIPKAPRLCATCWRVTSALVRRGRCARARAADPGRPLDGRHDRRRDGGGGAARGRAARADRAGRTVARRSSDRRTCSRSCRMNCRPCCSTTRNSVSE